MYSGLFHKCILQSAVKPGFVLNNGLATAMAFAKHLGCTSTDAKKVLEFLRQADGKELTKGFVSFSAEIRKVRTQSVSQNGTYI